MSRAVLGTSQQLSLQWELDHFAHSLSAYRHDMLALQDVMGPCTQHPLQLQKAGARPAYPQYSQQSADKCFILSVWHQDQASTPVNTVTLNHGAMQVEQSTRSTNRSFKKLVASCQSATRSQKRGSCNHNSSTQKVD